MKKKRRMRRKIRKIKKEKIMRRGNIEDFTARTGTVPLSNSKLLL